MIRPQQKKKHIQGNRFFLNFCEKECTNSQVFLTDNYNWVTNWFIQYTPKFQRIFQAGLYLNTIKSIGNNETFLKDTTKCIIFLWISKVYLNHI